MSKERKQEVEERRNRTDGGEGRGGEDSIKITKEETRKSIKLKGRRTRRQDNKKSTDRLRQAE